MFSYAVVLTAIALHILSAECARKQNCPSGIRSEDTNECYCYVNGTLQLCWRQWSRGTRFTSVRQKQASQLRGRVDNFSARIVGGRNANISDHPYMLAMEYWGILLCGATMISQFWALTAAHCAHTTSNLAALKLRAYSEMMRRGGRTFKVIKSIRHEDFTMSSIAYDVAVLKVAGTFKENGKEFIPALLPEKGEELPTGTKVTVIGWGRIEEDGYLSQQLQEVQLPILSTEYCQEIYGDLITDLICAGYPEGQKDACQSDSGGPMIFEKTVVGIVSSGEGCARENRPGIYTKVSAMRDWIREKTGI